MRGCAWFVVGVLLVVQASAQEDRRRLTSATNVRVRVEPSVEVRILATLPLGTDLLELARHADGEWVRVRTPDKIEGWVFAALTQPVPKGERARVLHAIVQQRLAQPALELDAAVELVEVIEELQKQSPQPVPPSALALTRLRAVAAVARALPARHTLAGAAAVWVAEHEPLLVYNEPGAMWMLSRDAILRERDRYADSPDAERMTWFMVETGLPGECEGDLTCELEWVGLLEGAYLRLYPDGGFVSTALGRLMMRAVSWRSRVDEPLVFDRGSDCTRIASPLADLRKTVAAVTVPEWNPELYRYTLQILDDISLACSRTR